MCFDHFFCFCFFNALDLEKKIGKIQGVLINMFIKFTKSKYAHYSVNGL